MDRLVETVRDNSQMPNLEIRRTVNEVEALMDEAHAIDHVCCGHDLIAILGLGLQKVIGTRKALEVSHERLGEALRLAYEKVDFMSSELYRTIRAWEVRNSPFMVLKASVS